MDEQNEIREPRVYEFSYLLMPSIGDAGLDTVVKSIKKIIADHGGLEISEGAPQQMDLAYDMAKIIENKSQIFSHAYFGWLKFDVSPEKIESIQSILEKEPSLLRSLLIKTVREDTMVAKKPARKREVAKTYTKTTEVGESEVVNEAELNEKLDALTTTEA